MLQGSEGASDELDNELSFAALEAHHHSSAARSEGRPKSHILSLIWIKIIKIGLKRY